MDVRPIFACLSSSHRIAPLSIGSGPHTSALLYVVELINVYKTVFNVIFYALMSFRSLLTIKSLRFSLSTQKVKNPCLAIMSLRGFGRMTILIF